jgi:uncharacterized membrane protein YeaQ/YmgE (transglycosylase-associated protein family)
MQELAQAVIAYIQQKPLVALGTALVAGFAANKTVAYDRATNLIFHLVVGSLGFFLGQLVILFFGLIRYLEALPDFRLLFDFVAAYLASFVIAALINFVKPL